MKHEISEQTQVSEAQIAGRGVLAIALAKLYFIFVGLLIQLGLPRIVKWVLYSQGISPELVSAKAQAIYGDYKLVNNTVSQLNNTVITGTVQTVSRFASAQQIGLKTLKRRALLLQLLAGGALSLSYALLAGPLASLQLSKEGFLGESAVQALAQSMRVSALIVLAYSFYAIFIGVLNGQRRFIAQASFDIGYTTIKAVAIIGAAAAGWGVFGIFGAFAASAIFICLLAALIVGPFSGTDSEEPHVSTLAKAGGGIFGYTLLFNLLLFADSQLLRPLLAWGLKNIPENFAQMQSIFSGVYGAVQNVGLVPYQFVIAVTFVVFPMVSRASFAKDQEIIRHYIHNALRYSLLILFLLVSTIQAAPRGLLSIPHGLEYAIGANALRIYSLAQIFFALLAVSNTILIGTGNTRKAAESVALGLFITIAASFFFVPYASSLSGASLSPVLSYLAFSALLGIFVGLLRAMLALYRLFQIEMPWKTFLRGTLLISCVVIVSIFFPESIPNVDHTNSIKFSLSASNILFTLLRSISAAIFVVLGFWLLRELHPEDLKKLFNAKPNIE